MAKSIQELQQDAQEVLDAFTALEAAASTLNDRLSEAVTRVASARTAVQEVFADLLAEVDALQTEVTHFEGAVTTSIGSLDVSMTGDSQEMAQATTASSAAFAACGDEFDAAVSALQTVDGNLKTAIQDYQDSAGVRHAAIATSSDQTQQTAESATSQVAALGATVTGLRDEAAAFAGELEYFLYGQRQQLEHWHDSYINDATQNVKDLAERMAQAGISQIKEPMEKFMGEMQREVRAEATQLLEHVLAGVEEGLRKIEEEIVQAAGGTQTKRQMMAPVREALDVVKEPIDAVMDTVRSTASIVGFGV